MSRFPTLPMSGLRGLAQDTLVQAQLNRSRQFSISLTPSQVGANSTGTEVVTVVASSDDDASVQGPPQSDGMLLSAEVTAKNQVTVYFHNTTGGAITPVSGTYRIRVNRS